MSKTNLNTKNLIKNFESGEVTNPQENGGESEVKQREHIASVFGLTRKLVSEYEGKKFGDDPSLKRNSLPDDISELRRRGKLNVLIVFAHWERDSFNGALLDTAVAALKEEGHEVVVSDLYRLAFNPLPSKADIQGLNYYFKLIFSQHKYTQVFFLQFFMFLIPLWFPSISQKLNIATSVFSLYIV